MIAGGITPRQTKFETNKEKLRQTLRKALATAASFDEFSSLLLREGVTVKESRGRLSYLTPDRTKPITARKLGGDFDRTAVLAVLEQNAQRGVTVRYTRSTKPPEPPNRPQPYPNTYTPGKAAYRAKRQGKSTPDRTVCSGLWTLSRRWPRARAKAMNDGRRYTI